MTFKLQHSPHLFTSLLSIKSNTSVCLVFSENVPKPWWRKKKKRWRTAQELYYTLLSSIQQVLISFHSTRENKTWRAFSHSYRLLIPEPDRKHFKLATNLWYTMIAPSPIAGPTQTAWKAPHEAIEVNEPSNLPSTVFKGAIQIKKYHPTIMIQCSKDEI